MTIYHYLSDDDLKELANYKYRAGMSTYLDDFLSQYFWGNLVHLCPIYLAPNVLTLVGFICSAIGAALALFYSPQLESVIPPCAAYTIAVCIFLYQTLDALDGKQARRTGSAISLGTLFDHGCDVLTTTFVVIINLAGTRSGITSLSMAILTITHLCQFICIWYEYYFNYFIAANNRFVGVTELQYITIFSMIFTGLTNGEWPAFKLCGYEIGDIIPIAMFTYQFFQCVLYIGGGILSLYNQQRSDDRDPEIKLRRAITQVCNFVPFIILEWVFLNEAVIIGNMYIPTALGCVLLANSTVCIRFILASCSHRTFHSIQWPTLPFCSTALILTFGNHFGMESFQEYSKNHLNTVGLTVFIYQVGYFFDFVIDSINGMARTLKIRVFHIDAIKKD